MCLTQIKAWGVLTRSLLQNHQSSPLFVFSAGGVRVLRVSRRAVPLAPPKPGAGPAALQRGAALGRHGDPAVSVAAKEDPAAPQVHQDRSTVSPERILSHALDSGSSFLNTNPVRCERGRPTEQ